MKLFKMRISICYVLLACLGLACTNKDRSFPNFKYQTVYFAYQGPVRTITLGEDQNVNTDLDNAHKCEIYAATGGVYSSPEDVMISVEVDNSLTTGKLFGAGKGDIIPMPANYYSLQTNIIKIPAGTVSGGVEVQLTDAFFADPNSIKNTYVIPLRMTGVLHADSILAGKDYILYGLKYINPWHGNYLRRGKDMLTIKNVATPYQTTVTRHAQYVEKDEVNLLTTVSMSELAFPVVVRDKDGNNVYIRLILKFDANGNCTVSSGTSDVTAQGTGSFIKRGEKNSWGSKDRDALYLSYEIDAASFHVITSDTLVMRDRTVTMETFTPVDK
ncbi:hypothetical protein GCM10027051_36090 [Niabella terrae]